MTVKEWREKNPDTAYTMVYASDAASFGRKGMSVYGSKEATAHFTIVDIEIRQVLFPHPHDFPVLHVWDKIVCTEPCPPIRI